MRNFILIERGQVYQLDPMTRVTVLNPTRPLDFSSENDNSIVLKMEVGQVSFLFTGDCEIRCEQSIVNAGFDLSATFLKVGHHREPYLLKSCLYRPDKAPVRHHPGRGYQSVWPSPS